jgi:hypothetical protein
MCFLAGMLASAQAKEPDLGRLEDAVARQFNEIRLKSNLPALKIRRDLRLRMEACSVQIRGPDPKVEEPYAKQKSWYSISDPKVAAEELARIAQQKTDYDHVGVGVWFAATEAYPNGRYWVVVYPENSAAHEAVWSHFYLTDDFEYQTMFDKQWRKGLPERCRLAK